MIALITERGGGGGIPELLQYLNNGPDIIQNHGEPCLSFDLLKNKTTINTN